MSPKSISPTSAAVHRALGESATDWMVAIVDRDFTVQYVNPAVRSILGRSPEDLVGKSFLALAHPEDQALASRSLADATTASEPTAPTLLRVLHQDGWCVHMEVVGHSRFSDPEIQGVFVQGRDVTERMRNAARLQESETRLREIFECVHDGLFLVDAAGRLVEGNRALCSFLGYGRHELIGLDVRELLADAAVWDEGASAPAGEPRSLEGVAVRRKDGALRYVDLAVTTLALPQSAPIVVSVLRDVTERREAERMKELFFGVVAHELRSPVAVLKNSLSILHSRPPRSDAEREEILKISQAEVDRLARIVEGGLDFSAIHAGRLTLRPAPTPLEPILRALATGSSVPTGREVRLMVEPLTARIDPGRFEQVVTNLLENAWRHASSATHVLLRAVREGSFARVSVEDDGPGIPESLRETLFERYYLLSDRPTRGMGIGLWLSKRFVEAMGGSIVAEAGEGGKGSRVSFTVPLEP